MSRVNPAEQLSRALQHKDVEHRLAVLQAVGRMPDADLIPVLVRALRDESPRVRSVASQALVPWGAGAVPLLLERVANTLWRGAREYMDVLVAIGRPAIPLLCQALRSEDRHDRRCFAEVLGAIAMTCPAPELRLALPLLRRYSAFAVLDGRAARRTYRQVLDEIEKATAAYRDLPLPSPSLREQPEILPLPTEPLDQLIADLPLPQRNRKWT